MADLVCPDSSYVEFKLTQTFTGHYRTGEPRDVVTQAPRGFFNETLASNGMRIDVHLRDCSGNPVVDFPRQAIVIQGAELCYCPGGNIADSASDSEGKASFTGPLLGGGCANELQVVADGIVVGTVPIKTNGPDWAPDLCQVGTHDINWFSVTFPSRYGDESYSICYDFDENGYINASDLANLAAHLGSTCFFRGGSR